MAIGPIRTTRRYGLASQNWQKEPRKVLHVGVVEKHRAWFISINE